MMQRRRACTLIAHRSAALLPPLQRQLFLLLWFRGHIERPSLPLGSSIRASCLVIVALNIKELKSTGLKFQIEGKTPASV